MSTLRHFMLKFKIEQIVLVTCLQGENSGYSCIKSIKLYLLWIFTTKLCCKFSSSLRCNTDVKFDPNPSTFYSSTAFGACDNICWWTQVGSLDTHVNCQIVKLSNSMSISSESQKVRITKPPPSIFVVELKLVLLTHKLPPNWTNGNNWTLVAPL